MRRRRLRERGRGEAGPSIFHQSNFVRLAQGKGREREEERQVHPFPISQLCEVGIRGRKRGRKKQGHSFPISYQVV